MSSTTYYVKDILLVSAHLTKTEGYHPVSSGEESTRDKVLLYLLNNKDADNLMDAYKERVANAIQWIKDDKPSQWKDNMLETLKKKTVDEKSVGLLASLFSGYDSYLRREEVKKSLQKSQHQGELKKPFSFDLKSYKLITQGKSKFKEGADYFLFQLLDYKNNVFIYYADKDISSDLSRCHSVKGIVRQHTIHDNINQTVIEIKELAK